MNTSTQVGLFIGLLLSCDVLFVFYGLRIFDALTDKQRTRVMIVLLCIFITLNATSIGFINGLTQ